MIMIAILSIIATLVLKVMFNITVSLVDQDDYDDFKMIVIWAQVHFVQFQDNPDMYLR